jgi:hypothetical protein
MHQAFWRRCNSLYPKVALDDEELPEPHKRVRVCEWRVGHAFLLPRLSEARSSESIPKYVYIERRKDL